METALIFTAAGCPPCDDVKRRIVDGHIGDIPVDVVDVETDIGFQRFMQELERSGAETYSIPSAFHEGKQCDIRIKTDGGLALDC